MKEEICIILILVALTAGQDTGCRHVVYKIRNMYQTASQNKSGACSVACKSGSVAYSVQNIYKVRK